MPLIMDPAPGFDQDLPHDMVHLVVEAELGLEAGLFGQLAAGGTAGSFMVETVPGKGNARKQARERKRVTRKGQALMREVRDHDISEIAAAICDCAWRSQNSGTAPPPEVAAELDRVRRTLSADEARSLDSARPRILAHFDRLGAIWRSLPVGQSLIVVWPSLAFQR